MKMKIQRVRSCLQCKEILPLKCKKCMAHPERKPTQIVLYDWPPILETGPCGCLKIACQAPGCSNTNWRFPRLHNSDGKSVAKTFCCSPRCATAVANAILRSTTADVDCSCGCGKKVRKIRSVLKLNQHNYLNPEHCYLHRRKMFLERTSKEKQTRKVLQDRETFLALLECHNGCRGQHGDKITEHILLSTAKGLYRCNDCGHERHSSYIAFDQKDIQSIRKDAGKAVCHV